MAINVNKLLFIQLVKSVSQPVERYIRRAFEPSPFKFSARSHVEQERVFVLINFLHIEPVMLLDKSAPHVLGYESQHIYRVLCRRIRRSVGELKLLQIGSRHFCSDRGSNNVYSLIDAAVADYLSA